LEARNIPDLQALTETEQSCLQRYIDREQPDEAVSSTVASRSSETGTAFTARRRAARTRQVPATSSASDRRCAINSVARATYSQAANLGSPTGTAGQSGRGRP
jgi:hypothetical protein